MLDSLLLKHLKYLDHLLLAETPNQLNSNNKQENKKIMNIYLDA